MKRIRNTQNPYTMKNILTIHPQTNFEIDVKKSKQEVKQLFKSRFKYWNKRNNELLSGKYSSQTCFEGLIADNKFDIRQISIRSSGILPLRNIKGEIESNKKGLSTLSIQISQSNTLKIIFNFFYILFAIAIPFELLNTDLNGLTGLGTLSLFIPLAAIILLHISIHVVFLIKVDELSDMLIKIFLRQKRSL